MTGKNRKFWQRLRSLSRGSMSEHGVSPDYETRSQYSGRGGSVLRRERFC
uniref:Uncharacterized protein n=1 Tax=Arundo donax TaxID=35708 RepID=A0A0A9B5S3_ARUDO